MVSQPSQRGVRLADAMRLQGLVQKGDDLVVLFRVVPPGINRHDVAGREARSLDLARCEFSGEEAASAGAVGYKCHLVLADEVHGSPFMSTINDAIATLEYTRLDVALALTDFDVLGEHICWIITKAELQ